MDGDPGHILEIIGLSKDLEEAADKLGCTADYLRTVQELYGGGEEAAEAVEAIDVGEFQLASNEAMPASSTLPKCITDPIPKSWLVRGRWPGGAKSPSWFKMLSSCPRKHAKRYRYKVPDPSGLDAIVGNALHGANHFAALLRKHGRRGVPSMAGAEELLWHLEHQPEVVHDRGTEVIKRCREVILGMERPLELGNVWGSEFLWSFHASPGLLVAGIADLILVYPDPRNPSGPPALVVVVDYKTGPGRIPSPEELRSDPQACLELIWAKRFFRDAQRVQFKLWNITQNQEVAIDWDYAMEQHTLAFARAAFHAWTQKVETPNVTRDCRYCPYRQDCKGYKKTLQAENYRPKEAIENMEIDALIAEYHHLKMVNDLADTRRKDIGRVLLSQFGPGQTKYQSNRFSCLRRTRKVEAFSSVSDTIFKLAEATGVGLGRILDLCTSLGDGKKLEAWIQTLSPDQQRFAKDIANADKQTRSSPPWIEVRERDALF